tara:strand:+ start:201 stop:449 length:249 start_codon:yes stop_codon:yes gene_type:complete
MHGKPIKGSKKGQTDQPRTAPKRVAQCRLASTGNHGRFSGIGMTCIDAHRHSRLILWDDAGVGVTKKKVEDSTHAGKSEEKE